jgi:hypothetical protein
MPAQPLVRQTSQHASKAGKVFNVCFMARSLSLAPLNYPLPKRARQLSRIGLFVTGAAKWA